MLSLSWCLHPMIAPVLWTTPAPCSTQSSVVFPRVSQSLLYFSLTSDYNHSRNVLRPLSPWTRACGTGLRMCCCYTIASNFSDSFCLPFFKKKRRRRRKVAPIIYLSLLLQKQNEHFFRQLKVFITVVHRKDEL